MVMGFNTLMWFKVLLFILLSTSADAGLPPTRILDEGTDQGVDFKFDCVGAGIACTQSGVTGTLTVDGGGSGDNITVNTTAATNANFLDNLYMDIALDAAATPDDVTWKFNFNAASGDIALLTNEVAFTFNGLVSEGLTADTIEGRFAFPDWATSDKLITFQDATDTVVGRATTDTLTNKTMTAAANVIDADTAGALAADPADCVTSTHFAVGVTAAGVAACEAIADADVPNTITVDLATTVTTNANLTGPITSVGNATTVASTVGGRSLTVTANVVDADAELFTWTTGIVIETPTSADNFLMHRVPLASTVTNIHCIVEAATSATIRIDECDTAGDNCTGIDGATTIVCDVDGQADDTSLSNAAIDATDWLRTVVTATSGTPGHVAITVTGLRENKVFVFYTES